MSDDALTDEDDESLALSVAADQNPDAAKVLVDRYAPILKGYLTENFAKYLGSHGIEDAVQTVFLRMLKYITSYNRKKGTFEGWMIRIAYNVAMNLLSRKDRHTYEAFTDEPVFYPVPPDDCEDDGKKDWRVQVLHDVIERKLKGFEQAVAGAYVATGGDIDVARLMKEWGKTRNHVDVAKSVVKRKFKEELNAAENQRSRARGKT